MLEIKLRVSKLDEKPQLNQQKQSRLTAQLSEWLGSKWLNTASLEVAKASYQVDWTSLELLNKQNNSKHYYAMLNQHPMTRIADANISANRTQVEMVEQSYTPQFGIEAMYSYR